MMEESSRFLSLSGLSGILVGVYALIGAFLAHRLLYFNGYYKYIDSTNEILIICFIAAAVLALSLLTGMLLTIRRARKLGKKVWNKGSKLMLFNLAIPLITGGIFILVFIFRGMYSIVSPGCLVFYGLALISAAKFTHQEIFYLGLFQILLGILASIFPGYGLFLWALGFGIMHIIYGTLMYFRYEHQMKG